MKTKNNQTKTNSIKTLLNYEIMKTKQFIGLVTIAVITLTSNNLFAQDPEVEINVNNKLTTCDIELSPNLTQDEWNEFTRQFGHIIYFNPMASAKPLGTKHFDITLDYKFTPIDQTIGAWNNTFHHPDSTHYLGDAIAFPGLHARMGVSEKVDVGIYFSHAGPFGGHYGFIGGEVKYAFLNDTEKGLAASVRGSYMQLISVKDFNFSNYGLDVSASKTIGKFTPYVGVAGTLSHSKEVTEKVNLSNENVFDARAIAGIEFKTKVLNLGAEIDVSELTTYGIKIGVTF